MKMRGTWLLMCIFCVLNLRKISNAVVICGDDDAEKDEMKLVFTECVDRLMAMRLKNWGWSTSQSIVLLQVAAPKRLIARERTKEKMKHDRFNMKKNQKMDLRDQALETIAVQSLCMNPECFAGANLMKGVDTRLRSQFPNNRRIPKEGYDKFSIAIASLCITNYSISPRLMKKFLRGQNSDGSFGVVDPIDDTIKLLPAMQCLRTMKNPLFNLTEVDIRVRRARQYVISLVKTNDMGEVIIGYKNLTSLALVGLWFSKDPGEDPSTWRCREAVETIGIKPTADDNEFQLGGRLMILTGKGFLNIGKEGYKCVQPDPIPHGYHPKCNPRFPATCRPRKRTTRKPS